MKKPPKPPGSYDVGHGRPPKKHQFKPGQSGNPNGRPKKVQSGQELFLREANKIVPYKQGDKIKKNTKIGIVYERVILKAIGGHFPSMEMVIRNHFICTSIAADDDFDGAMPDLRLDEETLRHMMARLSPPPEGDGE